MQVCGLRSCLSEQSPGQPFDIYQEAIEKSTRSTWLMSGHLRSKKLGQPSYPQASIAMDSFELTCLKCCLLHMLNQGSARKEFNMVGRKHVSPTSCIAGMVDASEAMLCADPNRLGIPAPGS